MRLPGGSSQAPGISVRRHNDTVERRWNDSRDGILSEPEMRTGAGRSGHRSEFRRSEEHTSELQSLMRISYAVFCLKKKKKQQHKTKQHNYKDNTYQQVTKCNNRHITSHKRAKQH